MGFFEFSSLVQSCPISRKGIRNRSFHQKKLPYCLVSPQNTRRHTNWLILQLAQAHTFYIHSTHRVELGMTSSCITKNKTYIQNYKEPIFILSRRLEKVFYPFSNLLMFIASNPQHETGGRILRLYLQSVQSKIDTRSIDMQCGLSTIIVINKYDLHLPLSLIHHLN